MVQCFQDCAPEADTTCLQGAAAAARPDLLDWEQQELCVQTGWNSSTGLEEPTSCIERHKGWTRKCADFARSCGVSYNACPTAAILRPDLVPQAEACLEDCAGLNACLNAVIYGE